MTELPILPDHPYAAFLDKLEKPARYTGGEVGSVVKDWGSVEATVCLAFPDVYDIGMSHLGFKILYGLLNDDPRTLAERCYAPWADLERELRARGLPLVSLESRRALREFSVVGFSLQFELTYTNILNMLELGGIPLRSCDRSEADPLVIAGGPVATHPEPLAPFVDAFVIGDGEEKASQVALTWERLRREGVPRRERLRALAQLGALYVPALYGVREDADTGLLVVEPPSDHALPFPIDRALVDLDRYPFPATSPVGGPEAIFDRLSIEIARGCTEGCRFCQAGMIYRPVRERDPAQIVETVVRAVRESGQDEVSLTALSTADVSCISPLVRSVAQRLADERVSLGVSSLRAYGLEPELLDEIKRVRATGLTFAPEAGTQRMRDVVNKNVTEEQLHETAERVFGRGWGKMKLYFMVGLPTEGDDDVRGVVQTGARTLQAGRRAAKGRAAEVTVSVSTHVPKPHTPFQWCAMDSLAEVERKQGLLRDEARRTKGLKLRTHDASASVLEGVFARGDRRLADVLERAFRGGARFDSWDDELRLDVWGEAFEALGVEPARYLGTLPVSATLPWSHIDVGLEEGFLASEYRKALASRLSPPCGKVAGTFVHHTHAEGARADARKLVCYDCGVACDLGLMRAERVTFLEKLGATDEAALRRRLPLSQGPARRATGPSGLAELSEPEAGLEAGLEVGAGDESAAPLEHLGGAAEVASVEAEATEGEATEGEATEGEATEGAPTEAAPRVAGSTWYRLELTKVGPAALLGHLDAMREVPRVLRRIGVEVAYTGGFHPKPDMSFSPALPLGALSLCEHVDVRLVGELSQAELASLPARMTDKSPAGLNFVRAVRLGTGDVGSAQQKPEMLSAAIDAARYVLVVARRALGADAEAQVARRADEAMRAPRLVVRRVIEGLGKNVDVRSYLLRAELASEAVMAKAREAGLVGELVGLDVDVAVTGGGSAKISEVAAVILGSLAPLELAAREAPGDAGELAPPHRAVRLELFRREGERRVSAMEAATLQRTKSARRAVARARVEPREPLEHGVGEA
jgi:radical SAM family uncharacterized protein/radical SAM-linked protein